ncbi:hypothetical protein C8Q75DRAFT_738807 [Abortiporus biennis]|nr:hypothetical protein C8Q75DRAFT_738807 [Abortiporus biennis]
MIPHSHSLVLYYVILVASRVSVVVCLVRSFVRFWFIQQLFLYTIYNVFFFHAMSMTTLQPNQLEQLFSSFRILNSECVDFSFHNHYRGSLRELTFLM